MDLKARREQLVAGQQAAIGQLQQLQANAQQLEQRVQQFAGAIAMLDEQLAPPPDATQPAAPAAKKKGAADGIAPVPMLKAPKLSRATRRRLAKANGKTSLDTTS